jgi:hypothetical protein
LPHDVEAATRQHVTDHFDQSWPHLKRAIDRMGERIGREGVLERLMAGSAQLWPGEKCAIVTEIDVEPDGSRTVVGWLAGGDLQEIQTKTLAIEDWARGQGCVRVTVIQRKGFVRKRLNDGYRVKAVVLQKELI